jgi:hypothetical protein
VPIKLICRRRCKPLPLVSRNFTALVSTSGMKNTLINVLSKTPLNRDLSTSVRRREKFSWPQGSTRYNPKNTADVSGTMRNPRLSFIISAFTRLYGVKVLLVYSWNLLKLMPERKVWILFVSMPTCTIPQRFPCIGQ